MSLQTRESTPLRILEHHTGTHVAYEIDGDHTRTLCGMLVQGVHEGGAGAEWDGEGGGVNHSGRRKRRLHGAAAHRLIRSRWPMAGFRKVLFEGDFDFLGGRATIISSFLGDLLLVGRRQSQSPKREFVRVDLRRSFGLLGTLSFITWRHGIEHIANSVTSGQ